MDAPAGNDVSLCLVLCRKRAFMVSFFFYLAGACNQCLGSNYDRGGACQTGLRASVMRNLSILSNLEIWMGILNFHTIFRNLLWSELYTAEHETLPHSEKILLR